MAKPVHLAVSTMGLGVLPPTPFPPVELAAISLTYSEDDMDGDWTDDLIYPLEQEPEQEPEPEPEPDPTDLFSPQHWAHDGYLVDYDEVELTRQELKHTTVTSRGFGIDTFIAAAPSDAKIEAFLQETELYNVKTLRWIDVPQQCDDAQELSEPMRAILDSIAIRFKCNSRAIMDSFRIDTSSEGHHMKFLPSFMALGWGSNFGPVPCPFTSGPSYKACASFIDLKTEKSHNMEDDTAQLGIYARRCFLAQHNRKFVYGLLLTEKKAMLYVFDRSGACHSSPLNIHRNPTEFVRMVLGIWSPNNSRLGFDTNVFWEQDELGGWHRFINCIDEDGDPYTYLLRSPSPIYDRRYIEGRGTCCWSTYARDGKTPLLIKEVWRDVKAAREWSFLTAAKGLKGVGQFVAAKEGNRVSSNRGIREEDLPPSMRQCFIDRRFCRMILRDHGGYTIERFGGRRDLLCGLRAAIMGHQNLWDAGILHADINTENILLGNTDEPDDGRGVLIDLDLAIWMKPGKPSNCHGHGTRTYASVNSIECLDPTRREISRDYLDDLESFFYLLCYICCTFTAPGHKASRPTFIKSWDDNNPYRAMHAKMATLLFQDYELTPYFAQSCGPLVRRFHEFVAKAAGRKRVMRLEREQRLQPAPTWADLKKTSAKDYTTVIGFFDEAIYDLNMNLAPIYNHISFEDRYEAAVRSPTTKLPIPPPIAQYKIPDYGPLDSTSPPHTPIRSSTIFDPNTYVNNSFVTPTKCKTIVTDLQHLHFSPTPKSPAAPPVVEINYMPFSYLNNALPQTPPRSFVKRALDENDVGTESGSPPKKHKLQM